jgi:hypothetical protein
VRFALGESTPSKFTKEKEEKREKSEKGEKRELSTPIKMYEDTEFGENEEEMVEIKYLFFHSIFYFKI